MPEFDWVNFATGPLLRILCATLLGGALGWDREWHRKPAGLRTHILVSLGAATFTLIMLAIHEHQQIDASASTRLDPLRIVEGIAGGIGFLGAGSILRSNGSVEGLTTAGSIWIAGAIGTACGGGCLAIAITATVAALVVLTVLPHVERGIPPAPTGEADASRSDASRSDSASSDSV